MRIAARTADDREPSAENQAIQESGAEPRAPVGQFHRFWVDQIVDDCRGSLLYGLKSVIGVSLRRGSQGYPDSE